MNDLININTASAETIATLPGIGTVLAEKIVTYRNEVRHFAEPIELVVVPGISTRMIQEIAPRITVVSRDSVDESSPSLVTETTESAPDVTEPADDRPIAEERITVIEPSRATPTPSVLPTLPTIGGWQLVGLGALLGMVLTLGVLALLNRTLFFGSTTQLQTLQTEIDAALERQGTMESRIVSARRESAESLRAISTLEVVVTTGMGDVMAAGQGVTLFLDGMENIVRTLRPEEAIQPVLSATPTASTISTATPDLTRTVRPTATPIGTPNN